MQRSSSSSPLSSTLLATVLLILSCFTALVQSGYNDGRPAGVVLTSQSFKAPNFPFWNMGGQAMVTDDFVRLASTPLRSGIFWNREPNYAAEWTVDLKFKIHGKDRRNGAGGMAFWYVKNMLQAGNIFGNQESFDGIAVLFDTKDNNNNKDNPSVIAIQNNGGYVHWDYDGDFLNNQLGRCKTFYRNARGEYAVARIEYSHNTLTVSMDPHGKNQFAQCLMVPNVHLDDPKHYHFGLSAANEQTADNYDVFSFEVRGLDHDLVSPSGTETSVAPEVVGARRARRRGWYDPYKQQQQANAQAADTQQPSEEAILNAAPPARHDLGKVPNVASPAYPPELASKARTLAATKVDLPSDFATNKVAANIVRSIEGLTQKIKLLSSKTDVNTITNKIHDMVMHQVGVEVTLDQLRDNVRTEVASVSTLLKEETKHLDVEIKKLDGLITGLNSRVQSIKDQQSKLVNEHSRSSGEVLESYRSESSFGFWTFFVLIQIAFAGLLLFYKLFADQSKKTSFFD